MTILPQLEENKGTISSKLGKALAQKALDGDRAILDEAAQYLAHEHKWVRAGAAKIIEQVALSEPSLVVEFLPRLLPALDVDEPQTRWMAIHTLGLCAALDTPTALKALPKAESFIDAESGACLWGSTIIYLGYLGATSEPNARAALPPLERALKIPGREKNVLRSFIKLMDVAGDHMRSQMAQLATPYVDSESGALSKVARQVLKKASVA